MGFKNADLRLSRLKNDFLRTFILTGETVQNAHHSTQKRKTGTIVENNFSILKGKFKNTETMANKFDITN